MIARWLRIVVVLLIYGGLLAGGHWGSGWLIDAVGMNLGAGDGSHDLRVMVVGLILYTALMAMPFVPGMEISLGLLALFGPRIAMAVLVATVVALGLQRAKGLVERLEPLGPEQRLRVLVEHAPKKIVPILLKHRYIAIIVALNIPGNAIIGGGGGIALLAGMSGLFTVPRFLLTVAIAALPVPLFVMITGA